MGSRRITSQSTQKDEKWNDKSLEQIRTIVRAINSILYC
jgi:hypothetical protein